MEDYAVLIFFTAIGGIFSLLGGILLLRKKNFSDTASKYVVPFAAGALLAAVFLDLLPEGIEQSDAEDVLLAALVGILIFFLAERFLRWFHHHHGDEHETVKQKDASVPLIIAGDTLHNVLDGVAIAAAFLISVPTGIVTTLAVAAHEIPQEIGEFGLLLSKGMKKRKVLLVNILSSLATVVAAVTTYALGSEDLLPLGIVLGLSAGFLLYIALSDIIPTIHAQTKATKLIQAQTLLLLAGVIVVGALVQAVHAYVDNGHSNSESAIHTEECDGKWDHVEEIHDTIQDHHMQDEHKREHAR